MGVPKTAISSGAIVGEFSDLTEIKDLGRQAIKSWTEAQTKESRLKMSGVDHVQMDGFARFFPRIKKRSYKVRTARLARTSLTEQNYDRRVLMTTPYEDALGIDRDDLMDSSQDIFADAMAEQKNAQGRLCDSIILYAQHAVTYEVGNADYDNLSSPLGQAYSVATFLDSLDRKYQLNLYHKGLVGGASTVATRNDIKDFKSDDLELVIRQFRKRNVADEIVCALTTDLSYALRVDSDFKASERTFNPSEQVQSGMYTGFIYRGIRFIPVLDDVLVKPNSRYLSAARSGGASDTDKADALVAQSVFARSLEETSARKPLESGTAPTIVVNAAGTSITSATWGGTTLATSAAKESGTQLISQDSVEQSIAHFWVPKALKFADRPAGIWTKRSDRPDLSHAEQLYSRINFGCLNIDSDYVVGVVTKGKAVAGGVS